MPEIGEIQNSKKLGYNQSCSYIWLACKHCSKERWVRRREYTKSNHRNLCKVCSIQDVKQRRDRERAILGFKTKPSSELGLKAGCLMYLNICKSCGKEEWRQKNKLGDYCFKCSKRILHSHGMLREKNPRWTGGRYVGKNGYVHITVSPDDPFYPMAAKRNHKVAEHRLVVAKHLNRCLESWEVVHHINGIKGDNSLENLELLPSASSHTPYTRMEIRIRELEKRVTTLEAENILLKAWQEVTI